MEEINASDPAKQRRATRDSRKVTRDAARGDLSCVHRYQIYQVPDGLHIIYEPAVASTGIDSVASAGTEGAVATYTEAYTDTPFETHIETPLDNPAEFLTKVFRETFAEAYEPQQTESLPQEEVSAPNRESAPGEDRAQIHDQTHAQHQTEPNNTQTGSWLLPEITRTAIEELKEIRLAQASLKTRELAVYNRLATAIQETPGQADHLDEHLAADSLAADSLAAEPLSAGQTATLNSATENPADTESTTEHSATTVEIPTGASCSETLPNEQLREIELNHRFVQAETATQLNISEWSVANLLSKSVTLHKYYPVTLEALNTGLISEAHLNVILEAGRLLNTLHDVYEAKVIPIAVSTTPGRLRALAKEIVEEILTNDIGMTFSERHKIALKARDVTVTPLDDGMALLKATLDAVTADAVANRLTKYVKAVKVNLKNAVMQAGAVGDTPGDAPEDNLRDTLGSTPPKDDTHGDTLGDALTNRYKRLTGEIRADILADLLLTGDPTEETTAGSLSEKIKASVEITIMADQLGTTCFSKQCESDRSGNDHSIAKNYAGKCGGTKATSYDCSENKHSHNKHSHSEHSGENGFALLTGYGPIDLNTARELTAGASVWQRVITDPVTGTIKEVDRYKPTKQMREFLRVRDKHCRFPGCRARPERSEIDHTVAWQDGGKTKLTNLAHLCKKHHMLKHQKFIDGTRWQVEQCNDGILKWRSPLGYEKTELPGSSVQFQSIPPPF